MEGIMICDTAWSEPPEKVVFKGKQDWPLYVPEPPTCTMEPDGYYGEQYGIYRCSNCGETWQFDFDQPKGHGWKCCPHCMATIEEVGE